MLAERDLESYGTSEMRQALDRCRAMGPEIDLPAFLALLAELGWKKGRTEEALAVLAEALTMTHRNGELKHEAEIHRLHGELLLKTALPDEAQAERYFRQALDLARRQSARSLELRAAMSLTRLLARQGNRDEGRGVLAEVYAWFTEGFETADLHAARALLNELGGTNA